MEFLKSELKPWELEITDSFPTLYYPPTPRVQEYINRGYFEGRETVNLRYGFECREGWKEILREWSQAAVDFQSLVWKSGEDPTFAIYPCIIKEKFGTLTIQSDIQFENEKIISFWYNIQSSIENKSRGTCEFCGKYGKLRTDIGWVTTLCDPCRSKIKK